MNIPQQFHKLYHTMNPDIQISLAKPNKTIIGNLSEAYKISGVFKLGQINELSFSIPYYVEKNFVQVKNKNVDKIKQRYLLKVSYLGKVEWFIVTQESDDLNDTNIKHVTAYSLGYQLSDKYIRQWAGVYIDNEYRKESLNAKQVMDNVLSETSWKYNSTKSDSLFLTRYRAFEFSGTTKLDAIFNIAETFNAIVEWDTHNKEIIFHDAEKYGSFRGLYISDNKYLSSYEKVTKSDMMATRLKLYGKDGLTINSINPSGADYIEDLSYFLRGFNMDSNGNVISHSEYVTDGLCKAIIDYQNLIISKKGQFSTLLSQKENLESQLKDRQEELFDLNNELKAIQVEIDFAESQQLDASTYKSQESTKKSQITSKQNQINSINNNLNNVISQINALKNQISMNSNFTQSQLEELDSFIIEKTWENENITTAEELMELGRKELDKMNKPSSTYNISLVYLLRIAEAQKDVKKLLLGDKIKINKREMDETVEAQLIEMNIDFDDRNIDLTIANFSTNSDEDDLVKLIYKNSVATSTINLNKSKWDDISNLNNNVETILNNAWDSAKREIVSGAMQSVVSDNRGITTFDMSNPNKLVRIMGGGVFLSDDGGQTVGTAINSKGIYASYLVGRIVIGQELYMENETGKFTFNQDGVTIKNTSFRVITDSSVGITNGVEITPQDGIVITKSDEKVRTILNSTDGIMVKIKKGSNWSNEFWYDPLNERLVVDGEISARILKVNGQNVLTDNNSKINGLYIVNLNADTITAGTINGDIVNVINLNASNITSGTLKANRLDLSGVGAITTINDSYGKIKIQGTWISGMNTNESTIYYNLNAYSAYDGKYGNLSLFHESGNVLSLNHSSPTTSDLRTSSDRFVIGGTTGQGTVEIYSSNFTFNGNKVATQSWVSSAIATALANYNPPSTE